MSTARDPARRWSRRSEPVGWPRADLSRPARQARPGDRVAVLSPSFAAPGVAPAVHEQALRRLRELTGLEPVEYPTTRRVGASAADRAADLNAAFGDPSIRAVLATIGGEDQITVVPLLDPALVRADPKPFVGYSDNTNLLSWLWTNGVAGYYGGSTQVHLGPGPRVDPVHAAALRAALLTGERLEVTDPGESEDISRDWNDPAALTETGDREATESWAWAGPARTVTGPSWGGCIEVIQWILTAGRFPADPSVLAGGVLLLETSEELIPAREFGWILRSLGERGLLAAVDAVLVARPPTSDFDRRPSAAERAAPAPPSGTRRSSWSGGTTRTRSSASACRSATPGRSGSCRSAASSPSTEPSVGSGPTTPEPRATPGPRGGSRPGWPWTCPQPGRWLTRGCSRREPGSMTATASSHSAAERPLTALVDDVPADRWERASPCSDWSARDVVRHLVRTQREFLVAHDIPTGPEPDVDADPAAAWRDHTALVAAAVRDDLAMEVGFDGHFGPTTVGESMVQFYVFDMVVHRWDLARAVGGDENLTDAELDRIEAGADSWGPALYMDGVCAAAVQPPAGADRQTVVLARLGRTA